MPATVIIDPDLLVRLERLAEARQISQENLPSETIRTYLQQEDVEVSSPVPTTRRVSGGDEGRVIVAPGFNAPLPKAVEDSFYP